MVDEPAPWALAEAHMLIDLDKSVQYRYAATGESIEDEEDVFQYALKLTRMYGYDEQRARQRQAAALEADADLKERIVAITQYAKVESDASQEQQTEETEGRASEIVVDLALLRIPPEKCQNIPGTSRTGEATLPVPRIIPFPAQDDEPYHPLTWGLRRRRPRK